MEDNDIKFKIKQFEPLVTLSFNKNRLYIKIVEKKSRLTIKIYMV